MEQDVSQLLDRLKQQETTKEPTTQDEWIAKLRSDAGDATPDPPKSNNSSTSTPSQAPYSMPVYDFIKDRAVGLLKGSVSAAEGVVGLADLATGNQAGKFLSDMTGYDPKRTNEFLQKEYSQGTQESVRRVQDTKGFFPTVAKYLQEPQALMAGLTETAPSTVSMLAPVKMAIGKYIPLLLSEAGIAAGTPEAAAFLSSPAIRNKIISLGTSVSGAAEGAQTAGTIQEQGRQGGRDWEQTVLPAVGAGVFTGAITKFGGMIPGLRDVETNLAMSMIPDNVFKTSMLQKAGSIGKGILKEGPLEEMPQSWQEQVFTNLSMGKPWDEGISEAAAAGAVIGGAQGGGMTALSTMMESGKGVDRQQTQPHGARLADIFGQFGNIPPAEPPAGVPMRTDEVDLTDAPFIRREHAPMTPSGLPEGVENMLPYVDSLGNQIPHRGDVPPAQPLDPEKRSFYGYGEDQTTMEQSGIEPPYPQPLANPFSGSSAAPAVDLTQSKSTTPPIENQAPVDLITGQRVMTPSLARSVDETSRIAEHLADTTILDNPRVNPATGNLFIDDSEQQMAGIFQPAGVLFNKSENSWDIPPSKLAGLVSVLQQAFPVPALHPSAEALAQTAQNAIDGTNVPPAFGDVVPKAVRTGGTQQTSSPIGPIMESINRSVHEQPLATDIPAPAGASAPPTPGATITPPGANQEQSGANQAQISINDYQNRLEQDRLDLEASMIQQDKDNLERASRRGANIKDLDTLINESFPSPGANQAQQPPLTLIEQAIEAARTAEPAPPVQPTPKEKGIPGSLAARQGPSEGLFKPDVEQKPTAIHRSFYTNLKRLLGAGDKDAQGNIINEQPESRRDIGDRRGSGWAGESKAVKGFSASAVDKLVTYTPEIRGVAEPEKIIMSKGEAFRFTGRTAYRYDISNHYDADQDVLGLWKQTATIHADNSHAHPGVIFSNLVKRQGYSGYVFNFDKAGNEKWSATFSPVKIQENLGKMEASDQPKDVPHGPTTEGTVVSNRNIPASEDGQSITHDQLTQWVEESVNPKLPENVRVKVAKSITELPTNALRLMDEMDPDAVPYGYMDHTTGTAYLFSPSVTTDVIAREVLAHELITHHSLSEMLGDEKFDKIMQQIHNSVKADKNRFPDLFRLNRDVYKFNIYNKEGQRKIAEEYVAKISETSENPTWFQDIISGIRSWLRDMGLNVSWTDQDIRAILRKSSDYLFNEARLAASIKMMNNGSFAVRESTLDSGTIITSLPSNIITPAGPPVEVSYLVNGKSVPQLKDLPNDPAVRKLWTAINAVVKSSMDKNPSFIGINRSNIEEQLSNKPDLYGSAAAAWTDLQNFYSTALGTISEPRHVKITTEPTSLPEQRARFMAKKKGPLADNDFYQTYLRPYMDQAKRDIDMAGPVGIQAFVRNNRPTVKAASDRAVQNIAAILDEYTKSIPKEITDNTTIVAKEKVTNWKEEVDKTRDFVKRFKDTVDVYRNIWLNALEAQAGKTEARPEGKQEYLINGKPMPDFTGSNSQAVKVTMEKIHNLLKLLSGDSPGKRLYAQLGVQKVLKNVGKGELGSWRPGLSQKTFSDLVDLRKWYYDTFGRIDWRNPPEKFKTVYVHKMTPGTTPGKFSVRIKSIPFHQSPQGTTEKSSPARVYDEAVKPTVKGHNSWIRQSDFFDNSSRQLMIQFSTHLINKNATVDSSTKYYDALYSGSRPGYTRLHDFWEIPQWMGFASHFLPNADVYVIQDMAEAKKFLSGAGYERVLLSAIDVNIPLIKELASSLNNVKFNVGGYTETDTFTDIPNIIWHDSMESFADTEGFPYSEGTDYRHFTGSAVVPRLTMSKGCLSKCAFCTVPKKLEMTSNQVIDQQAMSFGDLDAGLVYLNDKTFGQAKNYEHLVNVKNNLEKTNPNFTGFIVQTTAASINKMSDEFLRDSGIKYVELGVESYNDLILKDIHKPHNTTMIDKAVDKLRNNDIQVIPNIIIGLPAETAETYAATQDFLNRNADVISHANIYNLAIYKGSELASKITSMDANDIDENVMTKSFHVDKKIHADFSESVFSFGQKQLSGKPPARKDTVPEADKPWTFKSLRNTKKSLNMGNKFQQDIEPAGVYMVQNAVPGDRPGWEAGTRTFKKPLVVEFNPNDQVSYNEHSWKAVLAKKYGVTGADLTNKLQAEGYDGIVTVVNDSSGKPLYTKEIVDLKIDQKPTVMRDHGGSFLIRQAEPPKGPTMTAYKLFRTLKSKPGEIFPLFIGNKDSLPLNQWLTAEPLPTAGYKDRPGWHSGETPGAPHLTEKGRVWAEIEIPSTTEQPVEKQPPSPNGQYRYKVDQLRGGEWILSGSMKVKKILTSKEIQGIRSGNLAVRLVVDNTKRHTVVRVSDNKVVAAFSDQKQAWDFIAAIPKEDRGKHYYHRLPTPRAAEEARRNRGGEFAVRNDVNGQFTQPNDRWYSQPLTLSDRFREAMNSVKEWWHERVTPQLQHFKDINYKDPSQLPIIEYLRQAEEIPRYARELVGRFNQRLLKILKKDQDRDTYEHLAVLRDMLREATIGVVFQKGPQQVSDFLSAQGYSDLTQLQAHVTHFESLINPAVQEALNLRKSFWDRWRNKAVTADILPDSILTNDDYFHHQVKAFQELNDKFSGTAPGMHKTKKSFQKARTGYAGEYNLNYFEGETGVLIDLITQVQTAKSLQDIRNNDKLNVLPRLVAEADRLNTVSPPGTPKETWKTVLKSGLVLDTFGNPITEQTHEFYKPVRGNFFHKVLTLTERSIRKVMEEMENVIGPNPTIDELMDIARIHAGTALAAGLRQPILENYMVLNRQIINAMEHFQEQVEPTFLGRMTSYIQTQWKRWILFNPFRVTRYLLNNTTGDADIAFAFRPGIFKHVGQAYKELHAWAYKDSAGLTNVQRNKLETLNRKGVLGSGITVQEIPEFSDETLTKLINDPKPHLIKRWFNGVHKFNNFRENIMRLAAWEYMNSENSAGRFADLHYAASKKAEIDAIDSMDDKIVKMTRELIGDYGNISYVGSKLRRYVIPFWSWTEINAPRYFKMMKNELRAGNTRGGLKVAGVVGAKAAVRAFTFAALVMAWNFMFFRDEEEEMRRLGRDQLHLILGRHSDGSVISLRVQGSFSDTLGWIGAENLLEELRSLKKGRVTPAEEAKSILMAPVKRLIGGITPVYKTAAEAATGKSMFPEPFATRPIRDKFQHIMKGAGLDWITDRWVSGKPAPPLFSLKTIATPFLYITDTHEAAYFHAIKLANDWLKDQGLQRTSSEPTPRSNALYYWRQSTKLKDKEGEEYYKALYLKLGGKQSGMKQSIKHTDPLVVIPLKLRAKFLSSMGEDNKKTWRMGVRWWKETFSGYPHAPGNDVSAED